MILRTICRAKLHGVTVTEANLQYTGSLTLDALLMRAAGLVPYEQVQVVNINNGARLETYCIEGAPGSGTVCVNGAAARLAVAGDKLIVISYAQVTEDELETASPRVVFVDERNQVREIASPAAQLSVAEDQSRPDGSSPRR